MKLYRYGSQSCNMLHKSATASWHSGSITTSKVDPLAARMLDPLRRALADTKSPLSASHSFSYWLLVGKKGISYIGLYRDNIPFSLLTTSKKMSSRFQLSSLGLIYPCWKRSLLFHAVLFRAFLTLPIIACCQLHCLKQ